MRTGHITTISIIGMMLMLQLAITFYFPLQEFQADAQHTNNYNGNGVMYNSNKKYGHSELPQVATYGNNIYVIWLDDTLGSRDVFLRRSTDGGNTFDTKIIDLSKNSIQGGGGAFNPKIIASANDVYVVWENTPQNNGQIFFAKSNNTGNSFSSPVNLGDNTGFSGYPQIAVSKINSNYVYIVWHNAGNGIIFRKSTDGGNSFGKVVNLSNNVALSFQPQLAVSNKDDNNNNVYVAWIRTQPPVPDKHHLPSYDIVFRKSINNGETFEDMTIKLVNNSTGFADDLRLDTSQTNVYALWTNGTIVPHNDLDLTDIVFTKSLNNGNKFDNAVNINNYTGWSFNPKIAVSGNDVYTAWIETPHANNGQIMFRRSLDNGTTFENKIINLSNNTEEDSFDQSMVTTTTTTISPSNIQSNNNVNDIYVVWNANATNGNEQKIDLRKSTDGGNSFGNIINLNRNNNSSNNNNNRSAQDPQIGVSRNSNNLYVVWDANSTSNSKEILFKRITAAPPATGTTTKKTITAASPSSYSGDNKLATSSRELGDTVAVSENANKYVVDNSTNSVTRTSVAIPKIALIKPTFTAAAYDNAFYIFYRLNANTTLGDNITKHIELLSNAVLNKTISETASSVSSEAAMHYLEGHLKWLMPESNVTVLADQDVHNGYIFKNEDQNRGSSTNDDNNNIYDVIILGHQEYVTQNEYNNLKQFVRNGGTLIILDSNIFYGEVKYDTNAQTITLVKGHEWAFNGKSAWKSIPERWKNETSEWVGSNFLCYLCQVRFDNNPFAYQHSEEQFISNPKDKILLDYNASIIEHQDNSDLNSNNNNNDNNTIIYNNTNFNDTSQNQITKPKIATYELDFGKGKVISLSIYADDIIDDHLFNKFLDSLLFRYASKER
jgi:hypothetical protein